MNKERYGLEIWWASQFLLLSYAFWKQILREKRGEYKAAHLSVCFFTWRARSAESDVPIFSSSVLRRNSMNKQSVEEERSVWKNTNQERERKRRKSRGELDSLFMDGNAWLQLLVLLLQMEEVALDLLLFIGCFLRLFLQFPWLLNHFFKFLWIMSAKKSNEKREEKAWRRKRGRLRYESQKFLRSSYRNSYSWLRRLWCPNLEWYLLTKGMKLQK